MKWYGLVLLCVMVGTLGMAGCPGGATTTQTKVLFSSDRDGADLNSGTYTMEADGSHPALLTNMQDSACFLMTQGPRMVFAASQDVGSAIYCMNLDGTGRLQLTDGTGNDSSPVITSDGSRVVFLAQSGSMAIRSVMTDGTGLVTLLDYVASDGPAVRPDSTQVAIASSRDGNSQIYVVDQEGGPPIKLTQDPGSTDWHPIYSSDGSRIAYLSRRNGETEIYVMNADGTGQTNVSNHGACNLQQFSPDGTKVAFTAGSVDGHYELWVADLVNGGTIRLTDQSASWSYWHWSPDSSRIGFTSVQNGIQDAFVINPDGTGLTNLTHDPVGAYGPEWSPDGQTLYFVSWRDQNTEIYSMNPDGTGQKNLTNNPAEDCLRGIVQVP